MLVSKCNWIANASSPIGLEKDIIPEFNVFRYYNVCFFFLEFRCYFCDELKKEDPFMFGLSGQKKEPVCIRCHEKMEVVRRLREGSGKS